MARRYLNLRQIADIMGVSRSWLHRHLSTLEDHQNFPPAIAGMGSRREAEAVLAWLAAAPETALPQAAKGEPSRKHLQLWRAELDRRAEALAELDQRNAEIARRYGPELLKTRIIHRRPQ
jgi:predicted DNA-binding transcriptional regulator AlpA